MVIVTTAVYWGLNSNPHPQMGSVLLLTFQHRAGVSAYTAPYSFARTCVFNKQSLPPILCDPPPQNTRTGANRSGLPFSQSYGNILPSSLTMIHSHASVHSHQTTRVGLGYGQYHPSRRGFSRQHRHTTSHQKGSPISPHPRHQRQHPGFT